MKSIKNQTATATPTANLANTRLASRPGGANIRLAQPGVGFAWPRAAKPTWCWLRLAAGGARLSPCHPPRRGWCKAATLPSSPQHSSSPPTRGVLPRPYGLGMRAAPRSLPRRGTLRALAVASPLTHMRPLLMGTHGASARRCGLPRRRALGSWPCDPVATQKHCNGVRSSRSRTRVRPIINGSARMPLRAVLSIFSYYYY